MLPAYHIFRHFEKMPITVLRQPQGLPSEKVGIRFRPRSGLGPGKWVPALHQHRDQEGSPCLRTQGASNSRSCCPGRRKNYCSGTRRNCYSGIALMSSVRIRTAAASLMAAEYLITQQHKSGIISINSSYSHLLYSNYMLKERYWFHLFSLQLYFCFFLKGSSSHRRTSFSPCSA